MASNRATASLRRHLDYDGGDELHFSSSSDDDDDDKGEGEGEQDPVKVPDQILSNGPTRPAGKERRMSAWERRAERLWAIRQCRSIGQPLLVGGLYLDVDEIKACMDLGLDIPAACVRSAGASPVSTWSILSPGDDPKAVKERLKAWARRVAMICAPRQPPPPPRAGDA